jgi:hypothetical protein
VCQGTDLIGGSGLNQYRVKLVDVFEGPGTMRRPEEGRSSDQTIPAEFGRLTMTDGRVIHVRHDWAVGSEYTVAPGSRAVFRCTGEPPTEIILSRGTEDGAQLVCTAHVVVRLSDQLVTDLRVAMRKSPLVAK